MLFRIKNERTQYYERFFELAKKAGCTCNDKEAYSEIVVENMLLGATTGDGIFKLSKSDYGHEWYVLRFDGQLDLYPGLDSLKFYLKDLATDMLFEDNTVDDLNSYVVDFLNVVKKHIL